MWCNVEVSCSNLLSKKMCRDVNSTVNHYGESGKGHEVEVDCISRSAWHETQND